MLNLVQLQERLRDVPMQALMQYANGANPQVPPFLALTELNRRKKMQEGAAADQAAEMEGAPTVKEQIEQASGLLALQGSRQRMASQNQAGIQAKTPMAAPNTTTSEPAQLAAGGFIDDIVVPRDYQGGGMVNPDMMKRLMMMKAMQRRPGVAGLPMRQDMFKRGDYAGGGIVAFNGTEDSVVRYDPEKDVYDESKPASSMGELFMNALTSILPTRPTQRKYRDPVTGEILSYEEYMARSRDPKRRENYSNEGRAYDRSKPNALDPIRDRIITNPSESPKSTAARADEGGIKRLVDSSPARSSAVRKYINIDPATALPEITRRSAALYARDQDEFDKEFGISSDPFRDLKRRYEELESEDKRTRSQQPLDQLSAFLSGVAEARGGTFGTQGAKGARAARELRAQQIALNRKQDLDMAGLQGAIAEKEDAIARGNRDKAMAADQKIVDYNRTLAKDRLAISQTQAQIENQAIQADASARQAGRPTQTEQITDLLLSTDPRRQEAGRILAGASRTGEITDSTLLNQWNDLSIIDKQRLAKLQPPVLTFNDYKNYIRNSQGTTGATGAGVGGVTVRLPDGRTATFPNQAAADKFKKDAGIK